MGKKITVSVTGGTGFFNELSKRWPSLRYGVLANIGYEGRRALYESFLQGQVISLYKYPRDKAGRRTVMYSIAKNLKSVRITSYPLNLYNPKSVYNSASSVVRDRVESALKGYDEKVLQKRIDALDRRYGKK